MLRIRSLASFLSSFFVFPTVAGLTGKLLGELMADGLGGLAGDGALALTDALAVVPPSLRRNHKFVSSLIRGLEKDGELSTAVPAFDVDRARNLAKYASEYDAFADHKRDFTELVENNSRSIVDESQKGTGLARREMGYTPTITRSTVGETCDYCNDLSGTREYNPQSMDKSIFSRHRNCDCLIELNRNGETEVVNNYTRTNSDVDPSAIAERLRLTEQDPDAPSIGEMIKRRMTGEQDPNNRGVIAGRIVRGEYNLKQKHQKYLQHVKDSPQYKNATKSRGNPQSYLSVSEDEAQKLIYRYAGKGNARIENDIVKNVEFVTVDHAIGYYNEKGVWHETDRMQIIYSKSGTHVVPTNPRR